VASWLSDVVRDGALNEILARLNRSADGAGERAIAERTAMLSSALDELAGLLGRGRTDPVALLEHSLSTQELQALRQRAAPALELAVHRLLGQPEHKLAAYGTLVPGERNHRCVEHLRGAWQRCFVHGSRWTGADGDPRFRWDPDYPEVDAMLLVSKDLPSAWAELDRFEGSAYRRRLVPLRAEDGYHVAYLYESADQAISK
jgi:gamma-glutamylcyclotransferase (GGCT)/AIG2-like uncharacterized protein YtfP